VTTPPHAVFGLTTPNLGDDLQALTVAMHAPHVSTLLHRESLAKGQTEARHVLVMNYWFMSKGWKAAPHANVDPIFHGFCVGRDELLAYRWPDYLARHAPIGCRDARSVALLTEKGIAAYWSGCITLFLGRKVEPVPAHARRGVLFVDVAPEAEALIPPDLVRRAERLSNTVPEAIRNDPVARWAHIARICDRIRTAELVVTRRLHTALPATGFGTPVALVVHNKPQDVRRFSGYERFLPLLIHDDGKLVKGIDWDAVTAPVIPEELVGHYQSFLEVLGARLGTLPEGRAAQLSKVCRFRLPNPGLGPVPGEVEIDLGVTRIRRVPEGWSDQAIDLAIDAFPGFERFDVPVAVRAPKAWAFTPVGRLKAFAIGDGAPSAS